MTGIMPNIFKTRIKDVTDLVPGDVLLMADILFEVKYSAPSEFFEGSFTIELTALTALEQVLSDAQAVVSLRVSDVLRLNVIVND